MLILEKLEKTDKLKEKLESPLICSSTQKQKWAFH